MDKENLKKGNLILLFLALFGFSVGLFDNFADLWLVENGLSSLSVSNVRSLSYVITVLILSFFTIKFTSKKLKRGMSLSLLLKVVVDIALIALNGTGRVFEIKFLMFFDIALTQLILSCIYPLMMKIEKTDVLYTKKTFVETLAGKLGFLLITLLLGRSIGGYIFTYNTSLLMSTIITFTSLIALAFIELDGKSDKEAFKTRETIEYFSNHKTLYLYLVENCLSSVIWSSILGMKMLTLTKNLEMSAQTSSFIILGLGIISTLLSMVVVKRLNFKNDNINLFFKYGIRIVFYVLTFITNSPLMLLVTILLLLLTDCIYGFIFGAFFVNNIDERYTLVLTTLKYCTTLIGDAMGVWLCGLVFEGNISTIILPALIVSLIHYALGTVLVKKKKTFAG